MKQPRWLLMGTPQLAADVFATFLEEGHHVIGVVTQPDKKVGRNQDVQFSPVKQLALKHGLPVFQPERIRLDPGAMLSLDVDYILTLAYGQIVPQSVLDLPRVGAFNLHGSILPALRGASPLRYALIENLSVTGVTLMKMVMAMDAGDMYAQATFPIEPDDNHDTLVKKFTTHTQAFIRKVIPQLVAGTLSPEPQDESAVTFAPLIKKEHEHLPLHAPASTFLGWVRGLAPDPGGYLILDEKHIKLFDVVYEETAMKAQLGTILSVAKDGILFQGQNAIYRIRDLQIEGKPKRALPELVNGYAHWIGKRFR